MPVGTVVTIGQLDRSAEQHLNRVLQTPRSGFFNRYNGYEQLFLDWRRKSIQTDVPAIEQQRTALSEAHDQNREAANVSFKRLLQAGYPGSAIDVFGRNYGQHLLGLGYYIIQMQLSSDAMPSGLQLGRCGSLQTEELPPNYAKLSRIANGKLQFEAMTHSNLLRDTNGVSTCVILNKVSIGNVCIVTEQGIRVEYFIVEDDFTTAALTNEALFTQLVVNLVVQADVADDDQQDRDSLDSNDSSDDEVIDYEASRSGSSQP